MNPRVSIILTTYNRPLMLERAIQSVLEQDYNNFELIIMDDNSTDPRQQEILHNYWNTPKVIIFKTAVEAENRQATARYATNINTALRFAKGEFITYICDDDAYFPDRLSKMVAYFDTHPNVYVVYGQQRISRIEGGIEVSHSIRAASEVLQNANCLVDHSSVMHRKYCSDFVGDWNDNQDYWGGADGQYWEKLGNAGFFFYPIALPLDEHVIHDGSWTRDAHWKTLGSTEETKQ